LVLFLFDQCNRLYFGITRQEKAANAKTYIHPFILLLLNNHFGR
jgi:hypothetical protein